MIRSSAKMTALAAVALLGGVTAFNCSRNGSGSSDSIGHVNLALTLPSGSHINAVTYLIHSAGTAGVTDVSGTINTTDLNATPTAFVSFPASMGDTVTLTADTTAMPSVHCTGSSMPFSVLAGAEAQANVNLICGGAGSIAGTGNSSNIHIVGTVTETNADNCPQITSWTISPLTTSFPGGTIDVTADATDADVGETLTYAWGPTAKFTMPSGQMTQYHCTAPGGDTITLNVTDSHTPSCTATLSFPVTCVDTTATGAAGSTTGAAGATGAAGSTTGAAGATTGAAGATGAAGSTTGAAGSTTGAAGSTTGAAGSTTGAAGTVGQQNNACTMCEESNTVAGNCFNTTTPTGDPSQFTQFGCNGFTGAALTACLNLLSCLETPACTSAIASASGDYGEAQVGNDDPLPCLCGSITKGSCLGLLGQAESTLAGVCAVQYRAAAASVSTSCITPSPVTGQPGAPGTVGCVSVLQATYDPSTPLGVPSNLLTCNVDNSCACP